jgi:phosphoribosylformylglycinamidine synthase PurS subunit
MYEASVYVTFKNGILDPEGKAVRNGLVSLGYDQVEAVKTGRFFLLKINAQDRATAEEEVRQICEKLLVNMVLEDYTYELREVER